MNKIAITTILLILFGHISYASDDPLAIYQEEWKNYAIKKLVRHWTGKHTIYYGSGSVQNVYSDATKVWVSEEGVTFTNKKGKHITLSPPYRIEED